MAKCLSCILLLCGQHSRALEMSLQSFSRKWCDGCLHIEAARAGTYELDATSHHVFLPLADISLSWKQDGNDSPVLQDSPVLELYYYRPHITPSATPCFLKGPVKHWQALTLIFTVNHLLEFEGLTQRPLTFRTLWRISPLLYRNHAWSQRKPFCKCITCYMVHHFPSCDWKRTMRLHPL